MQELEIKTTLQISKPLGTVFEAIINPKKMSHYFISESTGRMETGKNIIWKFPEFDDMDVPVKVIKTIPDELINFEWEGSKDQILEVKITLEEKSGNATLVTIREGKMQATVEGIAWYGRNTEGWANFLACLKAYLEHGINLRKGAFEFMRKN
tara:strand:+ start:564 stop:1022 length:459 start_codon:yes stop_codon:yes gene_type:complete